MAEITLEELNRQVAAPAEPIYIGPTWQRTPEGRFVLPDLTIGYQAIMWAQTELLSLGPEGGQLKLTAEQARFILHFYAVDDRGRFLWRDVVLQRLKGFGKDPLAAVISLIELVGPCRYAGIATKDNPAKGIRAGQAVGKPNPNAWIQIAAVSSSQTVNTMAVFPQLISDDFKKKYRMTIGKEIIYSHGGSRRIQAVTSNPKTLEGARPSLVIMNETHLWVASNDGHAMSAVIRRNAVKSRDGAARTLAITNAYAPHDDSVAQRRRETWEAQNAGLAVKTGIMYDSVEAPTNIRLKPERPDGMSNDDYEVAVRAWLAKWVTAIRGDAIWLDVENIVSEMLDENNPQSDMKRFYLNVITTSEDSWVAYAAVRKAISRVAAANRDASHDELRAGWLPMPDEPIVVFGDGSKSDDSTGLVGCRLSDGYVFTIGVWQKPPGERGDKWLAPRGEVDARVTEMFQRFNVKAFWFDPSHAKDDSDSSRYWDGLIDTWMQEYGAQLQLWSTKTGHKAHAIMFDMASPDRQATFVAAAETFVEELENFDDVEEYDPLFTIDGHAALLNHLQNARMWPTKWGTSLAKEGRESLKKIDLAVCAVGARMLRRIFANTTLDTKPERSGAVWGA
jgi:hypothetical protein